MRPPTQPQKATTSIPATTSLGRCHCSTSVEQPAATVNAEPMTAVSGRNRDDVTRKTSSAAEAATVVCPDGSELASPTSTPLAGRLSTVYLRIWVLALAAAATPTATRNTDQLRRTSTITRAAMQPSTTDAAGSAFRNAFARSYRPPFQTSAPAYALSSICWPMRLRTKTR